eukprot:645949_1
MVHCTWCTVSFGIIYWMDRAYFTKSSVNPSAASSSSMIVILDLTSLKTISSSIVSFAASTKEKRVAMIVSFASIDHHGSIDAIGIRRSIAAMAHSSTIH